MNIKWKFENFQAANEKRFWWKVYHNYYSIDEKKQHYSRLKNQNLEWNSCKNKFKYEELIVHEIQCQLDAMANKDKNNEVSHDINLEEDKKEEESDRE